MTHFNELTTNKTFTGHIARARCTTREEKSGAKLQDSEMTLW